MDRKPKTIFQLDSPFTNVQWPETSSQHQETVLELLCRYIEYSKLCSRHALKAPFILSPIGQYRATNAAPSKGKRSKKRKREEKKSKDGNPKIPRLPVPEISSFVVVGLNRITRSLESLSQKSKALKTAEFEDNDVGQIKQSPDSEAKSENSTTGQILQPSSSEAKNKSSNNPEKPLNNAYRAVQLPVSEVKSERSNAVQEPQFPASEVKIEAKLLEDDGQIPEPATFEAESQKSAPDHSSGARSETMKAESLIENESVDRHFAAIFVPRSSQPPILHAHLPQLIATACLAHPELPATRLVQLPKGCDKRLCEALGLPRVSFIGILDDAPHSKSLIDLVRECVLEIEIPWLQEAEKDVYLPVKINSIETFVPIAKKEQ